MFKEKLIKSGVSLILQGIGENISRQGLRDTPRRVADAYKELCRGYSVNVKPILDRTFEEKYDEIILIRNIELISLCEHHLLPFYGKIHVAYIPKNKVLGLSKIIRLVNVYAKRLQLQERLTNQIAHTLMDHLEPKGVGVICQARHMCMGVRGVRDFNAETVTSSMLGCFLKAEQGKDPKSELMKLIT